MGYLTKDQLLAIHRSQTVEVEAPEMGGKVLVRTPSAAGADRMAQLHKRNAPQSEVFAEMIRNVCVTDELLPMFATAEEAAAALEVLPMPLVIRIATALGNTKAKPAPAVEATPDGEVITSAAEPDPGNE